ncbi:MAG: N-formimino-L-glutamate deiminase [Bacteroidetes bacterium ADurb.BinA261]|nr:MAG: N-formimino-L-glutamate deiminase [Bacteroidetes bacterium ADurb.BinA261]
MYFQPKSLFFGSVQISSRLFDRKNILFAENIRTFGQFFFGNMRQHFVNLEIDEIVFFAFPFGRNGMCTKISGDNIHRMSLLQTTHHAKLFKFRFSVEPIAAFPFHRGDSEFHHGIESLHSQIEKIFFRSGASRFCRIDDAATSLHDFHVAVAAHAPRKFFFAIAAKYEVCV